jgi:hypothetical protein
MAGHLSESRRKTSFKCRISRQHNTDHYGMARRGKHCVRIFNERKRSTNHVKISIPWERPGVLNCTRRAHAKNLIFGAISRPFCDLFLDIRRSGYYWRIFEAFGGGCRWKCEGFQGLVQRPRLQLRTSQLAQTWMYKIKLGIRGVFLAIWIRVGE